MGNELSEPQELRDRFPPLVVQVEALLWPGVERVVCEIFLQNAPDATPEMDPSRPFERLPPRRGDFLAEVCSSALPSQPVLVQALSTSSEIGLYIYSSTSDADALASSGRSGELLCHIRMPFSRLKECGLPLYTSLWLGLDAADQDGLSFDFALERAKLPEAPKLRVAVYKPCRRTLNALQLGGSLTLAPAAQTDGSYDRTAACLGGTGPFRLDRMWRDKTIPKPDVFMAFQQYFDDQGGAGCSGRDDEVEIGLTLPQQVMKLIECLIDSRDTISILQTALHSKEMKALPDNAIARDLQQRDRQLEQKDKQLEQALARAAQADDLKLQTQQAFADSHAMTLKLQEKDAQLQQALARAEQAETGVVQALARAELAETELLRTQMALSEASPSKGEGALAKELQMKDEQLEQARCDQSTLLELRSQLDMRKAQCLQTEETTLNELALRDEKLRAAKAQIDMLENELAHKETCCQQLEEMSSGLGNELAAKDQKLLAAKAQQEMLESALAAAEAACAFQQREVPRSEERLQLTLEQNQRDQNRFSVALQEAERKVEDAKRKEEEALMKCESLEIQIDSFQGEKEADIRAIHVGSEVQQAKLRAELKVLRESDEANRRIGERAKVLEAELAEARIQLSGTSAPTMPLRSLPDVSQLHQQAELENERKLANEERTKEFDAMKARLEQESSRSQAELAMQQTEDMKDLERRQDAIHKYALDQVKQKHKADLQSLKAKVDFAMNVTQEPEFQGIVNALRELLSEDGQAQGEAEAQSLPPLEEPQAPVLQAEPPRPLVVSSTRDEWRESPTSGPSVTKGTVKCSKCQAVNMICLDGPLKVQCGKCHQEFMPFWDNVQSTRSNRSIGSPGFGSLEKVPEEFEGESPRQDTRDTLNDTL